MKSARLLPLSHWIAFVVVGFYPLYSSEQVRYLPWSMTVCGLALLGAAHHLARRFLPAAGVMWRGFSLLGLDALLISFLIYHSGGIASPLFPLLFLLSATASLYDRWTKALLLAAVMSCGYLAACLLAGLDLAAEGARLFVNVCVLIGSSVLLSHLSELHRREESKAERIEALYRLSSDLMEEVDVKGTVRHILTFTVSLLEADVGCAYLRERGSGRLMLEYSDSPGGETVKGDDLGAVERCVGWVARERQPLLTGDASADPRIPPAAQPHTGAHSILAAPILVGGDLMGILAFASRSQGVFDPEDLQMLVTICNLAASIAARADLYQVIVSRSEVIVDSMSSGLLVTDAAGKVVLANQASRDLLGLSRMPRDVYLRELLESTFLDTEGLWEYMQGGPGSAAGGSRAVLEMRLRGTPERIFSMRASPILTGHEPGSGAVVIMEDITERVKVDEIRDDLMLLIAQRVEEQTALYEVGKSLTDEVDTRNLLEFLLSKAVDLVDAQFGALSLREGEGLYRIRAVYGLDTRNTGLSFLQGVYLAGEAALSGEPLRRTEIEPGDAAPWGEGMGFQISYLAAPITWQGQTTGIIEVASPSFRRNFGEDDLRLLSLFVNQAAIALENSNLYRLITEDQRRTEAMLHSINDGVIAINNEAQVILVNAAAERILNLPPFHQINEHHVKEVIRLPGLANIFMKSLNTRREMEQEVVVGPPERKVLVVETSLIETSPGERIGIVAVIRDVTELRELEQAKSDFVSTVSHELRTPLTSIKAYTATLRRKDVDFDEETRQEFLAVVEEEADRLTRLISDLLDVSRIESGRLELKRRDFDLCQLVNIVVDKLRSQAENHCFRFKAPEGIGPINADPDKIEQVLLNLLDNAVKYSPAGGDIDIALEVRNRDVELTVTDGGVGIPREHLPHIFDKFHRVDNRATREIYGTGLGLYVCKSIVEAHGGALWAESENNRGSVFHFNLPLSYRPGRGDRGRDAAGGEGGTGGGKEARKELG